MGQLIRSLNPLRRTKGVFYGWWLVGVGAFVIAFGAVPMFLGATAWFVVLEKNFGWNKAQLSWAFAFTRIEGGIMGPVAGYLVARLGPRRMVFIGFLILGAGFLLFSQVQNLWIFYLSFVIMGIGVELGTWLSITTVVNNWFQRHRASAIGWTMQGSAIGGILIIPALAWAIDPDRFGLDQWRKVAAGYGVLILLLSLPIARTIRNRPEDYGQLPDGDTVPSGPAKAQETGPTPRRGAEAGYTWREALRTRTFWLMTAGHACSASASVTLAVHLGPMLAGRGFSVTTVGLVLAVQTAVIAVVIPLGGYVGDRSQMKNGLFFFTLLQSVAIFIALEADSTRLAVLYAVFMGIGLGGRLPITTSMRGAYFGRRHFPIIMGLSLMPINLLMFAAPLFTGYMFDATDSYAIPFNTIAIVNIVGAFLYLPMGKPSPPPSASRVSPAAPGRQTPGASHKPTPGD